MQKYFLAAIFLFGFVTTDRGFSESTTPPCYRYSYVEEYKLGPGAPSEIKIVKKVGTYDGAYLFNPSKKPLIFRADEHHCIKLVDGAYFEGRECGGFTKNDSSVRVQSYTSLGLWAQNRSVAHLATFGSNDAPPPQPKPFQFEVPADFSGRSIKIPVTGSYRLIEKTCPEKSDHGSK